MTFRIEETREGPRRILRLSGWISSESLDHLKRELAASRTTAVLDLDEVTLLDVHVVRLLKSLERRGVELRNCPPYVRAWIASERVEDDPDGSSE